MNVAWSGSLDVVTDLDELVFHMSILPEGPAFSTQMFSWPCKLIQKRYNSFKPAQKRKILAKSAMRFLSRLKGLTGPAIILAAAAIAVGPLCWRGPACGGDFGFHFASWIDAEHSMSAGLLYPHWANSANFGAGEPKFVFYPPITWMAGAVLGMLLPWSFVRLALFILLLAATGMAT